MSWSPGFSEAARQPSCATPLIRLENWLKSLSPRILRVKGSVRLEGATWSVEKTVDSLTVKPAQDATVTGLILIAHEDNEDLLKAAVGILLQPMSINPPATAILACDVFQDELEKYGGGRDWHSIEYLEMGLHDQPAILRREIQQVINRMERDPAVETILLVYGLCGNGLAGVVSSRCRLVLPRAHDCVSILLGSPDIHQQVLRENPGTYFYSPGWIRGRRVPGPDRDAQMFAYYSAKYPGDAELLEDLIEADHETFAHHNCAAYIDLTADADAESYCRRCAASLGWSYRRLQGDPSLLRDLLDGRWDEARFLVAGPGNPVDRVLDSPIQTIQG